MVMAMRSRRGSSLLGGLLAVLGSLWLWTIASGLSYQAPPGGGLTRKQRHGLIKNKDKLEGVYEVPLEEEEEEEPEKPEMPERRVPYSMHIVTQLPAHKHLHEESNARQYIEEKLVLSLENFEDFIRHVEVHLQKSDNFHREKRPEKKAKADMPAVVEEESLEPLDGPQTESIPGHKMLTPYMFKATVTLANHHKITLSNPEKHAQATLTEATDHMVDVLKKLLREEKQRMLQVNRRKAANVLPDDDGGIDIDQYNKDLVEAKVREEEEAEEAMYQRIESSDK